MLMHVKTFSQSGLFCWAYFAARGMGSSRYLFREKLNKTADGVLKRSEFQKTSLVVGAFESTFGDLVTWEGPSPAPLPFSQTWLLDAILVSIRSGSSCADGSTRQASSPERSHFQSSAGTCWTSGAGRFTQPSEGSRRHEESRPTASDAGDCNEALDSHSTGSTLAVRFTVGQAT